MSVPHDEHERTYEFAEIALGQIKALRQPAVPRNFEIWYHYATGYNTALNRTINAALSKTGALSDADLELIYQQYIADPRGGERMDAVNVRVLDQIKELLQTIDAAAGTASDYSATLSEASRKIVDVKDADALHAIIEHLLQSTAKMELHNRKLEDRLSASRQEIGQLQKSLDALRVESETDPLTALSNRKCFDTALINAFTEAKTNREPLSLLMADIDRFKDFNDRYGHLTGDQVLRLVAMAVKQNVKGRDVAARYGGEEFVIALPSTPLQSALTVADHLRRAVMTKDLVKRSTGERLGRITISIGVALLRPGDSPQSLVERADKCLYAAKRNGRNRVICESDPEADDGAPADHAQVA